jgi:hypothetical protein
MLFKANVRLYEFNSVDIRTFEHLMGEKFRNGLIIVREIGSLFSTILWVGTDINVIVECGRLHVSDILNLFESIKPFMFPTNRTSITIDMEDIKAVLSTCDLEIAFYNVWENK